MKVRALTFWRPWPWAILSGSKRCENRPRRWNIEGYLLAIHAGQAWHPAGASVIVRAHPSMPAMHEPGVIEGAAGVYAVLSSAEAQRRGIPWATDAGWCYLLEGVVRFRTPIIGVQGRQGLFKLSTDVEAAVLEQWGSGDVIGA